MYSSCIGVKDECILVLYRRTIYSSLIIIIKLSVLLKNYLEVEIMLYKWLLLCKEKKNWLLVIVKKNKIPLFYTKFDIQVFTFENFEF